MKFKILTLSTITAAAAPLIVVSCSSEDEHSYNKIALTSSDSSVYVELEDKLNDYYEQKFQEWLKEQPQEDIDAILANGRTLDEIQAFKAFMWETDDLYFEVIVNGQNIKTSLNPIRSNAMSSNRYIDLIKNVGEKLELSQSDIEQKVQEIKNIQNNLDPQA